MIKFETGKTYSTRSACDYNCIFSYTVIKRTAKFITIRDKRGDEKRVGVKASYCGEYETALPEGHYSMCPVITAEKPARKPFPAPASREQSLEIAKLKKTMAAWGQTQSIHNENPHS